MKLRVIAPQFARAFLTFKLRSLRKYSQNYSIDKSKSKNKGKSKNVELEKLICRYLRI